MAFLTTIALTSFLFENQDLFGFGLTNDFSSDCGIFHKRSANLDLTIATNKQNIAERYLRADFPPKLLDFNEISFGNAVLFSTGPNYSVFHELSRKSLIKAKLARSQDQQR